MKTMKTIPNLITFVRLILVPFVLYLIFSDQTLEAVILFIFVVLTDKLDGVLARKLKQTSYYGGMFDALTDSILIFSTILVVYLTNHVTLILLFILFLPKIVTSGLLLILHKGRYKPTIFSRTSTVVFYLILPLFLLDVNEMIIWSLLIILYIVSITHWLTLTRMR